MNNSQRKISKEEFRNKYGLLRLKEKILNNQSEYSILEKGVDLTNFGLNLSSNDNLLDSFGSPFAPQNLQPQNFKFPTCYPNKQQLTEEKLQLMNEKTLFFIFFSFNEIVDKKKAALELCEKGWLYDKGQQTWYYKPRQTQEEQSVEYFDVESWEKKSVKMSLNVGELAGKREFQNN